MKRVRNILILDDFGSLIKKKRKRLLIINKKKRIKEEIPVKHIKELIILTKTSISTEIIKTLIENGVEITICSYFGKPIARIVSPKIGGSAINRWIQYRARIARKGLELVRILLKEKLIGQAVNLRYYSKSKRKKEISEKLFEASLELKSFCKELDKIKANNIDEARERFLNVEGKAAEVYWNSLTFAYGDKFNFKGRNQKSNDPLNTFLNIAYNILSIWVWKYSLYFSLDPFLGFLHVERPGKLSLVYDLMEPVRPIYDRLTLSYLFSKKTRFYERKWEECKNFKLWILERSSNYKVNIGRRKGTLRYAIFSYIQSVVSFLREEKPIVIPRIYW